MEKRVFVVDDEPQLLFAVQAYLTRAGYHVIPSESGTEALDKLLDGPPDLIISDIVMAEMDGFEFQRRVMALTGDGIPFIFLTARGDLQDRLHGLRGGADDYIVKPFDPEELEARIASVLHRVEQTRREERREVDYLRGRILSEVSSKLRTPVTSLMAHMNLMLSDRFGSNMREQSRYLESALEDANVLCELIDDLSWAAAQRDAELTLKREPVRIAPLVRGAAASAAKRAADKGVSLRIACGGLLSGNVDATMMNRALTGLLDAAVEMSPLGSAVEIRASRAADGGMEFAIIDGGCEASPWTPSRDLDDALDDARRVVACHGGQFTTERDDAGSQRFKIWIPGRVAKHVGHQN
jgi:CheY-like chemotaxis protein